MLSSVKLWVKVPGNQYKKCVHEDPVPSLVPEYKVSTLYSAGRGARTRILAWVLGF